MWCNNAILWSLKYIAIVFEFSLSRFTLFRCQVLYGLKLFVIYLIITLFGIETVLGRSFHIIRK